MRYRMTRTLAARAIVAAFAAVAFAACQGGLPAQQAAGTVIDAEHGVRVLEAPAWLAGGYGTGRGQFMTMNAIAVTDSGRIVVADNMLSRLTWFEPDGRVAYTRRYDADSGAAVVPKNRFRAVNALAAAKGVLYVGTPEGAWVVEKTGSRFIAMPGFAPRLRDIAVGPDGRIWALTEQSVRIYAPTGTLADSIAFIDSLARARARNLTIGADGKAYVGGGGARRVLVYSPAGDLVGQMRGGPADDGRFKGSTVAIAADAYGNLFVRDEGAQATKILRPDGTTAASIGSRGSAPGQTLSGSRMALDRARNRLVLLDEVNYRVQVYDLTGRNGAARDLVRHDVEHGPTERPDFITLHVDMNAETQRRIIWRTVPEVENTRIEYREVTSDAPIDWTRADAKEVEGTSATHASNVGTFRAHTVKLDDLRSGAQYAYRIGGGEQGQWSDTHFFTMAANTAERITSVVLGDSRNRMAVWGSIVNKSVDERPAFIINTGDLVSDGENMLNWNAWFWEARNAFDRVPMMPTIGNHERMSPNYFTVFSLPENGPEGFTEQAYSFDYGPAHWVVLNTEADLAPQAAWLEQDLRKNTKPWVFAFFHRPAYAGHPTRGDGNRDVRAAWCDLFERYGVDIAWQGHDHYYYRTKPVRDNEPAAFGEGPIYITTGGAGAPLYPVVGNKYSEVYESTDHYCVLTVTPEKADVVVYRTDGSVLDRFSLTPRRPEGTAVGTSR